MGFGVGGREGGRIVHRSIDILHCHLAMNFLHRFAGVLHRDQGFLVYVCGFDGVYLLLEHADLAICLLEGVFMLLLPFQGIPCSYSLLVSAPFTKASAYPLLGNWGQTHQSCSSRRSSSLSLPAGSSVSRDISHASAACPAAAVGRVWLSWAHLSASGLFARRTMTPTC